MPPLNGRMLARSLARDLAAGGFIIVSGLARGIDAEAHLGGLATGTIGVLEVASMSVIRGKTPSIMRGSPSRERWFPKRRPAWRPRLATFRGGTGSSRGFREASWWSKQTCGPAR